MKTYHAIDFFDKYVSLGLQPIALYPGTKRPVEPAWNKSWSPERWRPYFAHGEHNVGLLLGDVVDVEGDTNDANDLLERMIDGRPRPMYRSAKSVHNLFANPDPNLTRLAINGIEFRAWAHMSVAPPSRHTDGTMYRWLSGSVFPVPQMPDELSQFYFRNRRAAPSQQQQEPRAERGKPRNRHKTHCNSCGAKFPINPTRLRIEVRAFRMHGMLWMCRRCRSIDIRPACRDVRRMR